MVYHYFYTDAYQDEASPELGTEVDALAEEYPQQTSGNGECKRYDADDDDWQEDVFPTGHVGAGERDAHCQGVDTGSYGQSQYYFQLAGIEAVLVIVIAHSFLDHTDAEDSQQTECNPVVETLYQMIEAAGAEPSYKRHQCLKQSEKEGHDEAGTPTHLA